MKTDNLEPKRVLARAGARELSAEELGLVGGGIHCSWTAGITVGSGSWDAHLDTTCTF